MKSCLYYEARRWEDITSVQLVKFLKQNNVKMRWLTISGAGEFGLDLEGSQITDLSILRGMPLKSLIVSRTEVSNLSPLSEMSNLKVLNVANTRVTSLEPLKELSLSELNITQTKVSDLSPLTNMPLKVLSMIKTDVCDLTPIHDLPLEEIYFSAEDARLERTVDVLRNKKSLRCINYYRSTDEFWVDYDAGVFKHPPWSDLAEPVSQSATSEALTRGDDIEFKPIAFELKNDRIGDPPSR